MKKIITNRYVLALSSAVLLRLSYPKFDVWPLAWVAFLPLLTALDGLKPGRAFFVSFLSGFVFYLTAIFWLIHVTITGMVILSAYLALYVGAFGLGVCSLRGKVGLGPWLIFVPAWWVLLEFTRSYLLTGFPWVLLAYSQSSNPVAFQAADIVGAFGVSSFVMFVNVFLLEAGRLLKRGENGRGRPLLLAFLAVVAWFSYGLLRIHEHPKPDGFAKISVLQGNIAQEIKWASAFQDTIFQKYRLLSELAELKEAPDLIIWPETAFPDYLEFGENDRPLRETAASLRTSLLIGTIRMQGLKYFNSAVLLAPSGAITQVYDKIHLVPFGEYIPLRRFLPFIGRILPIEDFTAGRKPAIFSIPGRGGASMRFGVLICFEDIFGDLAAGLVRRGADFLVNMTNDAWFGDTASPYQHLEASIFRAVENRVFVVRAANTGVSCFIDDLGCVRKTVRDPKTGKETFVTGSETDLVYRARASRRSLYTQTGDLFAILCSLAAAVLIVLFGKGRAHER